MKKWKYIVPIAVVLLGGIGFWVHANPLEFTGISTNSFVSSTTPSGAIVSTISATATTSPIYMSAGKATSTNVYDAYQITQGNTNGQNPTAAFKLNAFVWIRATTGVPTLNLQCESSVDGIDYAIVDCYSVATTTTPAQFSVTPTSYTWLYATSSQVSSCVAGGVAASTTAPQATCMRAFSLNPISRFTRVITSLSSTTIGVPQGGKKDNADVFVQLVPMKEQGK